MSISYLSKIYESNPYTLPVDLNLLQKVNNYKQTLFYKNAEDVKGQLTQLQNADILNPKQRELLTTKVNNLTSQIHNMGGLDFSDMNVTNTLNGYSADIYNDPNVLNGIISTKNIREFNSNVQKMQTDPKLSKYYNTSNITRIQEEQIKPYINGEIDASYSGPTAPRPYAGNPFEIMLKQMKNLPPDIIVQASPSGSPALYNIQTKKFLSDQDISATFDGLLDGNTKAQLRDDAWYNFDYGTGYKFTKEMGQNIYNDDLLNRKNNYQNGISAIDVSLKTEIDPVKRDQLTQQKTEYQNLLTQTEQEITKGNNEFSKQWDASPANAKYALYAGRFRSDIIKAAGYSQEKNEYIKNEEWAFQKRKELEYIKHGLQLNSDGSVTPIPGMGKKKNAKGEIVDEAVVTPFNELASSYRTGDDLDKLKVNEQSIAADNQRLRTENNIAANNIIADFAKLNGFEKTMGYKLNVNTTGAGSPQTVSSDLITNITGVDKYLSNEDLYDVAKQGIDYYKKGVVNEKGIDTKTGKPYDYQITHDGRKFSMTYDQLKIITDLNSAWADYGQGKIDALPSSFDKGDFKKEFSNFAQKHAINELAVQANNEFIKNVYNLVKPDLKGLSEQEKQDYIKYRQDPSQFLEYPNMNSAGSRMTAAETRGASTTQKQLSDYIVNVIAKVKDQGGDKAIQKAFETASKNLNYYQFSLTDDPKNLPDGIKSKILQSIPGADPNKITPINIRIADDGVHYQINYNYTKTKGDDHESGSVQLTPAEAQAFGVKPPSNPALESLFKYGKEESPVFFVVPNISNPNSVNKPVFYKIKKLSSGFMPVVVYKNKEYPVALPSRAPLASDAEDAFKYLATMPYPTYESFMTNIVKDEL